MFNAGISDVEWDDFLKNAQAYEQMRQKLRNQPKTAEPAQKRGAITRAGWAGSGYRATIQGAFRAIYR